MIISMERRKWNHSELSLTFNLYCRLPFGQYHYRNQKVIKLAELINRSPSTIAMKLCNFASLDPAHQARGIKGLSNASAADKLIWEEYNSNWDKAITVSNELLVKLYKEIKEEDEELRTPPGSTDIERTVRQRRGQSFFRQAVLAAYGMKCCVTGTPITQMLVASHILPWSGFPKERLNPRNGICLSAIHDAAFDRGLMTLDEHYKIVLSRSLRKSATMVQLLQAAFLSYEGKAITMPYKFLPDRKFLQFHRESVFQP